MKRWFLAGAAALAAAAAAAPCSAAPEGDEDTRPEPAHVEPAGPEPSPVEPMRVERVRSESTPVAVDAEEAAARRFPRDLAFTGGLRLVFATDPGLAPYMSTGAMPELALGASLPLLRAGRLSLAVLAEWDIGAREATTRGDQASIVVNRLAGGLEGRLALASRLYAFARFAPSATNLGVSVEDPAAMGRPLEGGGWTWGVDTTGGAALMIAGNPRSKLHLWLVAEAGYGFTGTVQMHLAPSEQVGDPRTFGAVTMPDAKLSGAIGSLGLALAM